MKIHRLKCWPEYYQAVVDGKKKFEYRINDREFQVGDMLHLKEWDPKTEYTGRACAVSVDYIFPMADQYVIMSITLQSLDVQGTKSEKPEEKIIEPLCCYSCDTSSGIRRYVCQDCRTVVCKICLQHKPFCPNCGSTEFAVPKEKIEEEPVMRSRSTVACMLCVHNCKCTQNQAFTGCTWAAFKRRLCKFDKGSQEKSYR